jgi:hypothetical protein
MNRNIMTYIYGSWSGFGGGRTICPIMGTNVRGQKV